MMILSHITPMITPLLLVLPLLLGLTHIQGSHLLITTAWLLWPLRALTPATLTPITDGVLILWTAALAFASPWQEQLWLAGLALFCILALRLTTVTVPLIRRQEQNVISTEQHRRLLSEQEVRLRDFYRAEIAKAEQKGKEVQIAPPPCSLCAALTAQREELESSLAEACTRLEDANTTVTQLQNEYTDLRICYNHLQREQMPSLEAEEYRERYLQLKAQLEATSDSSKA